MTSATPHRWMVGSRYLRHHSERNSLPGTWMKLPMTKRRVGTRVRYLSCITRTWTAPEIKGSLLSARVTRKKMLAGSSAQALSSRSPRTCLLKRTTRWRGSRASMNRRAITTRKMTSEIRIRHRQWSVKLASRLSRMSIRIRKSLKLPPKKRPNSSSFSNKRRSRFSIIATQRTQTSLLLTKSLRQSSLNQESNLMRQAAEVAAHKILLKSLLSNLLQAPLHRELWFIEFW